MPGFIKDNTARQPFGKNEYRRSTRDLKYESYTCARASVPTETIDGEAGLRVLQSGEVIAKITSGGDSGKVGPFQAGVADGRQTTGNIVGVNDTFLPWQFNEAIDREIAVCYEGALVQAWCFERDAAGARIALTNTTRDAMVALATLALMFK